VAAGGWVAEKPYKLKLLAKWFRHMERLANEAKSTWREGLAG